MHINVFIFPLCVFPTALLLVFNAESKYAQRGNSKMSINSKICMY